MSETFYCLVELSKNIGLSFYLELSCLRLFIVSSEGALYVILPYDYQAAARPLFEHTPVLNNNFEY